MTAIPDRIVKENSVSTFKNTRRPGALVQLALASALLAVLGACSRAPEKGEDIRPVRAIQLVADSVAIDAEFPGEVRARFESQLGFRVGGKITSRKVDLGATVRRGQVLMQLDPQDLQLSQAGALAALRAAETTRDLAKADMKRFQELRVKNFVSGAVIDAKIAAWNASQSNVDAAQAAYRGQANQAGYATLVSDIDGVVTAVNAEVGQVVAPGMPVVRVAKLTEKEIVIGIPEDKVDTLRQVEDVSVRLWANPKLSIPGKIREISPIADAATRTYAVKVAIPDSAPEAGVRLGMTALVQFSSKTATPVIRVPLTALHQGPQGSAVWLVENGAVRMVPVQLGGAAGNDVVLAGGVLPGQTVVTAGANLLKNGQKVTLLAADIAPPAGAAK
jgi:multidrug efflux system membrane fusion protein